jgi:hypothetical protein
MRLKLISTHSLISLAAAIALLALAGCGSGGSSTTATNGQAKALTGGFGDLRGAAHPTPADFPVTGGKSLQQLASQLKGGPHLGFASTVYTPGTNRLAFGMIDASNRFVYGASAIYIAVRPNVPAQGPFIAPASSLAVKPAFRSQTSASDPGEAQAIYSTNITFPRAGVYSMLVVIKLGKDTYGVPAQITINPSAKVPSVGQRPPAIDTPTVASVHGNVASIDTRVPPDDMHAVSFRKALGKKPIALLFATPQLCQSRVCGPVTDIAEQLKATYGKKMVFIHQEVYNGNQIAQGLRPQLLAFHLPSEPWLFTINRHGRIAARLEGAFGLTEFQQAIQAALH